MSDPSNPSPEGATPSSDDATPPAEGATPVAPPSYPAAPPPPAYPAAPAGSPVTAAPSNGMGTIGLVMGILNFFCIPGIGAILAIIFGRIGMNKAKRGEATNGGVATAAFWIGIAGLVLAIIGGVIAVFAIGFGVKAATDAVDPAKNAETGLADGNYGMEPNTSLRLNDRCSFGGTPVNLDSGEVGSSSVSVVGEGAAQCPGTGTPDVVYFTVSNGVAQIVEVG